MADKWKKKGKGKYLPAYDSVSVSGETTVIGMSVERDLSGLVDKVSDIVLEGRKSPVRSGDDV